MKDTNPSHLFNIKLSKLVDMKTGMFHFKLHHALNTMVDLYLEVTTVKISNHLDYLGWQAFPMTFDFIKKTKEQKTTTVYNCVEL